MTPPSFFANLLADSVNTLKEPKTSDAIMLSNSVGETSIKGRKGIAGPTALTTPAGLRPTLEPKHTLG